MNFLGLDTTKKSAYIVCGTEKSYSISIIEESRKVSENLLVEVEKILISNQLELKDIKVLYAVVGPGSFTGIRIGLSTIKAFEEVFGCKCIIQNSFEVFENTIEKGWLILHCTNTSVYFANYKKNKITEVGVVDLSKIEEKIFPNEVVYTIENEQINIPKSYKNIVKINNYKNILADSIQKAILKKEFVSNKEIVPVYIQISQAERALAGKKEER